MFGCRCVIFLPKGAARDRVAGIRALGAETVETPGNYDDAVQEAQYTASEEGWYVVSDTAYEGYDEVPRHVMQGYTVMAREAMEQMPQGDPPSHVFLQAGVGGLAAAVVAYLWETLGPQRPRATVVEPTEADCLLETALNSRLTPSRGSLGTSMDCLACRNPSTLAWPLLREGADAFLSIPDYSAEETVALLGHGWEGDPPLLTQPSGAAGITGLLAASFEPALAGPLDLGEDSRVLVFLSEGPPRDHS
jgi:diaminopropionate ammonia-lyase